MPYKDRNQRNAAQKRYRAQRKAARRPSAPLLAGLDVDAGAVVAEWAAEVLKVPTGPLRGQPFRIAGWQRDFLSAALGPGVREAGLSVARKNGKSGLIAALLLAYLAGPLNAQLWRGIVVSLTGALAGELRDAIDQTAEVSGLSPLLTVKRSPPPGSIEDCPGRG